MCARPKLPESELKHPRQTRKSTTVASVIEEWPEPTAKEKKRWKPLLDACTKRMLENEALHLMPIRKKILLKLDIIPEGFPVGKYRENGYREYLPEAIIVWMYERKLSPYSPTMIYKQRGAMLTSMASLLNKIDIADDLDFLYNDCNIEEE